MEKSHLSLLQKPVFVERKGISFCLSELFLGALIEYLCSISTPTSAVLFQDLCGKICSNE